MGRKRARPSNSRSPDRNQPLRRSARLAGLEAQENEPNRATATKRSTSTSTTPINPAVQERESPGKEPSFAMKLVIQPPEKVAVGTAFGVPLVVTFTATKPTAENIPDPPAMSEISGVWAYLSLMTEDHSQSLAPPNSDLLQGQIVDSVHPVSHEQSGDVQTVGYATFANIVVSEPGRYCLRVTIIDMNNMMVEDPEDGGKVLPSLHSTPFDVVPLIEGELDHAQRDTETMAQLREIGVEL